MLYVFDTISKLGAWIEPLQLDCISKPATSYDSLTFAMLKFETDIRSAAHRNFRPSDPGPCAVGAFIAIVVGGSCDDHWSGVQIHT